MEIKPICHQRNSTTLSNKYVGPETGFPGGRKMRILPVKKNTKNDHSNKIINEICPPPKINPGKNPVLQ